VTITDGPEFVEAGFQRLGADQRVEGFGCQLGVDGFVFGDRNITRNILALLLAGKYSAQVII
jgi:hypothetical protein